MPELLFRQTIAAAPERVFAFFEQAENLEAITPPFLRFRIVSPLPIEMKRGTLIDYRLRLRGVPIRWRTLISIYDPPKGFVDEQVRGPYRTWIHEHRFEPAQEGGTLMTDRVRYELPTVPCRRLVDRWFVAPDLARIFEFRRRAIAERFATEPSR